MAYQVLEGDPSLRGALWMKEQNGTHFSVFSPNATLANLVLFDSPTQHIKPIEITLPTKGENGYWCGFVPGIKPGQSYCYRVEARDSSGIDIGWNPVHGLRINHESYVMDPEAWALSRIPLWRKGPESDLERPTGSNKDQVGLAWVIDPSIFATGPDTRPYIPWEKTTILETHVRDLTMRHPKIPAEIRGTYSALAHPVIIEYIKSLGTTLQIQPVMAFPAIGGHWGYMTIAFMAPHGYYSKYRDPMMQCLEFAETNRKLHEAGIEVILDFVPNHSGESGNQNPAMCFRGLANEIWYRLCGSAHEPFRNYYDYTGCGNTFNFEQSEVRAFFLRVLKHWATYYHVDGFRFDLAGAVFLTNGQFDSEHPFFKDIAADPLLRKLKWIAEPWDAKGNVHTERFPEPWRVTDGYYRNDLRRFMKAGPGDKGLLPTVVKHVAGISGRLPMITCHDGFTTPNLWQFDRPHNEANAECSGEEHNFSWNCGAEGYTQDMQVLKIRRRMYRATLAYLMLTKGPRLIYAGDPILHSRQGNNNPWAQDNELSHYDWGFLEGNGHQDNPALKYDGPFLNYCQGLANLRKTHPQLHRWDFCDTQEIHWFGWNREPMNDGLWNEEDRRSVGVLLSTKALPKELRPHAKDIILIFHADYRQRKFRLPEVLRIRNWDCVLDTSRTDAFSVTNDVHLGYTMRGRNIAMLIAK